MHRVVVGGLLAAFTALGVTSGASAYDLSAVQRSGNTYYKAACLEPAPGYARCHAQVVTDKNGNIKAHPPITGFAPADLQSAYKVVTKGKATTVVAIVDAFGYTNAEADLGTYRSQWGLSACTTANGCFEKLNQSGVQGSYPAQN